VSTAQLIAKVDQKSVKQSVAGIGTAAAEDKLKGTT